MSPPPRATHPARGDSAPRARSGGGRARAPRVCVASLLPAASSRCVRARAPLPTPAAGAWRACFTQGTARDARGARAIPALRGAPAAGGTRSAVRPLASLRPSRLVLLSVARRRSARASLRPPALTRRRCVRGERRAQGEPRSGRFLARGRPCAPRRGPSLSPTGLWRVLVPPRALVCRSSSLRARAAPPQRGVVLQNAGWTLQVNAADNAAYPHNQRSGSALLTKWVRTANAVVPHC